MSQWTNLVIVGAIFALFVATNSLPQKGENANREGRWFGYRYTSTEVIPKTVTSLIPSSCIQVEPSLPPCRSVRNLEEFPTFLRGYRQVDVNKEILSTIHTTSLGWGEYLGIYAPTVTVTAVEMLTTTVLDPRTVVTFSVKGCKPSRLPMDLNVCPSVRQEGEIKPSRSTAIVPTTFAFASTPAKALHLDADEGNSKGQEMPSNNLDTLPNEPMAMIQPTNEQLIATHSVNQMGTKPLPP